MKTFARWVLISAITCSLQFSSTTALADMEQDEENFVASTADLLIARPLGLATTALGTALFLVTLPVTAITKNTQRAADTLVEPPFHFTFRRRLGDF